MDGNSTISFFTAYGGGLLGIAQVGTAVVLAIFTIKLYHATARYADLVDSQNAIMKDQNGILDEQNKKVELQNLIMKYQNQLNSEKKDHDVLVMKYNRMLDEMDNLVAPLFARRYDEQIFSMKKFDSKIKFKNFRGRVDENPIDREFYEFWENIVRYSYLDQSSYLLTHINKYKQSIKNLIESEGKLEEKQRKFEEDKEEFIYIVEHRYSELMEQIKITANKLKLSESPQQASNPGHEYVCIEEET